MSRVQRLLFDTGTFVGFVFTKKVLIGIQIILMSTFEKRKYYIYIIKRLIGWILDIGTKLNKTVHYIMHGKIKDKIASMVPRRLKMPPISQYVFVGIINFNQPGNPPSLEKHKLCNYSFLPFIYHPP